MENQHRKISGYRDLTQVEIDLINRIKEKEAEVLALVDSVEQHLHGQFRSDIQEAHRQQESCAELWKAISRTEFEKGFMFLVRAVAQPQPANKGK